MNEELSQSQESVNGQPENLAGTTLTDILKDALGDEEALKRKLSSVKPPLDAPCTGDELADFSRLASCRHLKTQREQSTQKPLEIEVRKPGTQEFVRVRPVEGERLPVALIKDARGRNVWYVVDELLQEEFEAHITWDYVVEVMVHAKDTDGKQPYYLWPIPVEDYLGRSNEWWESWQEIAAKAETEWVKVRNGKHKAYAVPPSIHIPDPVWPNITYEEAFALGFKGHVLATMTHPFAKHLRGGQ